VRLTVHLRNAMACAVCALALASNCIGQSNPAVIASAASVTTDEQLHEWLTYYYLHPRPDLTISAIHLMSGKGWLSKANPQSPLAAFLAQVFASNSDKTKAWLTELQASTEDQRIMAALALWMAHNRGSEDTLKSEATKGSPSYQDYVRGLLGDDRPPDFLKDTISSAGFLDALWGSFLATGDERYAQRVISALPMLDTKGDVTKMLIGGAARWSLTSNAVQHPKVMEICEAELKRLPDDQKPALQEVIKTAREKKP